MESIVVLRFMPETDCIDVSKTCFRFCYIGDTDELLKLIQPSFLVT